MPLFAIQTSFAAGELSPATQGRVDLTKYAVGAKKLRNFFVHSHGGASNRAGTEFIAYPKYHDKSCILMPFQYSTEQAYMIETGDQYMRFFKDGGQILDDEDNIYEIDTPYFESELRDIKVTQSADVLYLCNVGHKPRTLSRKGHSDWTMAEFDYQDGPYLTMNSKDTTIAASATTGDITLTATDDVFLEGHIGSIWKLGHTMPSKLVRGYPNAPNWSNINPYFKNNVVKYSGKMYFCINPIKGNSSGNIPPNADVANWEVCSDNLTMEVMVYKTWRVETSGYWRGTIKVTRYNEATNTWQEVRSMSGSEDRNYSIDENVAKPQRMRIESTNFAQINKDNNAPHLQGYVTLENAHTPYEGWVQITDVTDATHASATVKKDIGSTEATTEWAEGAWSNVRGFPLTVVFYPGDRIVFAATPYQPQTVWMSKVGDYVNFGVSADEVKDDDGVTRTLPSREVNKILAMVPLKNKLAAFTSAAEWMIGPGNQSVAITPVAFDAQIEGYRGSSGLDPVIVGNRILYVQAKGATVQDVGYDISADGLLGSDLTVLSKHLFKRRKIVSWAYQQEPDSIVWVIRDDGALLGLTYLREHEVWAWHRHDTQGGKFEAVSTIQGEDYNEVWFVVKRGDKRYIERMAERMTVPEGLYPDDPTYSKELMKRAWFVDCGLRYDGIPKKIFSGLNHLEGKEVAILADGFVMPRRIVTDGKIDYSNLPGSSGFSVVTIGLPITSDLETLNIEYSLKDGTAQGRFKKVSAVTLRMEESRGGWVGPSVNKLDPMGVTIKSYGEALDLVTDDVELTLQGGYTKGGRIFIRQVDPLPMTISALIPTVEHGG